MLERTIRKLRDEPALFVKEILRATPDAWQAEALNTIAKSPRVAIRSGHGVGKTTLESWCVLWFLMTRAYPKVICSAPTVRQLYDVLWSEISKWLKRSPLLDELFEWQKTFVRLKAAPNRWFATARTAARPENLAGFHEHSILFVLDEASGISDEIFEAVEGALTTPDAKLLICGNPTRNTGFFKRAFFEDREIYQTFKVSSMDSGRVSDEYCKRLIQQYGADSDVVRVRVLGEFPANEADGLIALEHVEAAMNREPKFDGELVLGVDVARQGNDLTVLAARVGDDVAEIKKWQHADLMTTVGRILHAAKDLMARFGKRSVSIRIDDDGLGAGVTDRLREVVSEQNIKAEIKACHNGGKARDNRYANFVTECYFALKERLEAGEITLPRDDELSAELTTRKYSLNSSDKLILEKKEDFKKRIKRSPDRADAVVLAFAPVMEVSAPQFVYHQSYWRR
ncbi:MAG: DEAD/DEAH box helicase family protein [Clostridia bacterium]|nr:DEAD/DEAH box helicase family protein [Clostridia bacterium]